MGSKASKSKRDEPTNLECGQSGYKLTPHQWFPYRAVSLPEDGSVCVGVSDRGKNTSLDRHLDVSDASSSNPSSFTNPSDGSNINTSRRPTVSHRKSRCIQPRIDLLLVGETGNGKSATGNTIVRERTFDSGSNTSSLTKQFYSATTEYNGRQIKVVDGLTICGTRLDDEGSVEKLNEATKLALAANPEGYHAFLLVLKYGNRFTRKEKDAVDTLKKVLGENFLHKYCIIIMTCGDIFMQEHRGKVNKRTTFPQWCEKQDGPFKELLEECDNRLILFDNNTRVKKVKQIEKLINKVDKLLSARRVTNKRLERVQIQNLIQNETRPEVELTQVTNSRIQNEDLVSCENCICQRMPATYSPLDCPDSPPKSAFVLKDKSEEDENLRKEFELIKKKQQEIEENFQKKFDEIEQRMRDKKDDSRETAEVLEKETVDLVTLYKMLSQTNTVHVILAKMEELSRGFRDLTQTLESLQKQVSDESAFSRSCIEEIQQSRQGNLSL